MSGGYFGYIYCKEPMSDHIEEIISELESMADSLDEKGYNSIAIDVQLYINDLKNSMDRLNKKHDSLSKIMHDFGWLMSNDSTDDQFKQTANEYTLNKSRAKSV